MKQIFILEREELNDLKRGLPLKILLGEQTITLQADVPRRNSVPRTNGRQAPGGGMTITDRVFKHLKEKGPASAMEVANTLRVSRAAVASPLVRGKGKTYKRTGRGSNTVWSIK